MPDGRSGWFSLFPTGGNKDQSDMYSGVSGPGESFGGFVKVPANVEGKYDSYPRITPDGLYLLFSSARTAPGIKLHVAKVNGAAFDVAQALPLPTKPSVMVYANEPYLLANGTVMYFSAAGGSGSDFDLFRAEGAAPTFDSGNGRLLTNVTTVEDVAPVVAEDELEMFWASNRGDAQNKGDLDIWTATRTASKPTYQFDSEKIVPALSTTLKDYPTWLSPDACHLYLIQKNASGNGSLVVADR
jgi:hypothetical protein